MVSLFIYFSYMGISQLLSLSSSFSLLWCPKSTPNHQQQHQFKRIFFFFDRRIRSIAFIYVNPVHIFIMEYWVIKVITRLHLFEEHFWSVWIFFKLFSKLLPLICDFKILALLLGRLSTNLGTWYHFHLYCGNKIMGDLKNDSIKHVLAIRLKKVSIAFNLSTNCCRNGNGKINIKFS